MVEIEALGGSFSKLQNYTYFDSGYKAQFYLREDSGNSERFNFTSFQQEEWVNKSGQSTGVFINLKETDCDNSICWRKANAYSPDGPYNTSTQVDVSNIIVVGQEGNPDPIVFANDNHILKVQPQILFGRLNLGDVGGEQGKKITAPLEVEYWNGSKFVTNTKDNTTLFNGAYSCSQVIWSDIDDNASLSGSDVVTEGSLHSLGATQVLSVREPVRLYLELSNVKKCSNTSNQLPWLMYDWDRNSQNEENPSAVVTFGIFRGNDRIIFRGEKGMTGQ